MERRVLERLVRLFVSACPLGALLLIFATTALSLAAPQTAQAQTQTCTINWGTVPYRSTGNTYVMSTTVNAAVLAACDTRYPNVDSGLTPSPQSGASTGNGTWSGVTNLSDNTLTFSPHAQWAGPDTFIVYFCNAPGCPGVGRREATVNVTVANPTLSLTPSLGNGTVAAAYSQTLTASGSASPYTFSVVSGALPPGLSLGVVSNPNATTSTVALAGTPTAGGTFNFTIRATDSSLGTGPFTVDQAYTVTIAPATISVTTASVPNGTQNSAYTSTPLAATGGTSPYTWTVSAGALPTGLSLSTAGVLSGTPTQSGSFNFTARALDSSTGTGPYFGTRAYSFSIAAVAAVANPVSVTAPYGSTNNPVTLNITGGTATSVAVGTQATNGTATAAGTSITYTPTTGYAGPDSFTYTATNAAGTSAPATVTVTVSPPTLAISPASLPNGTTGVAYSQSTTGSGGASPYAYSISAGTLPAGLGINPTTGQISGTPTGTGLSNFTVRIQDSSTGTGPFSTTRPYSITIVTPNPPIANAVSGTVAFGSTNNPVTLNITGGAATSVAVGTQATNGTATAAGTSITYTPNAGYFGPDSFTYTATNADGTSAPATVTMTVNPQPPVANAASATVAFGSTNNPVTLNLTGGAAASVAVGTQAANGTATAAGTSITYTPNAGYFGPDSFTYTATNAGGTSAPATVTLTVNPQPPVANAASATVAFGSTNNPVTLNLTGGAAASVAVGTQAANGTATAAGTSITYTPNAGYFGPDSFTYTATNAGGTSAPATVTLTVNPQPPTANAVSATVAFGSTNNPITLNLTGGAPVSVAVGTQATNGTAVAVGTSITYTPNAGYFGPDSFTYTATNAGGTSAPATVTLTVNPQPPVANAASATVAFGSTNNPITLNVTGGAAASVAVGTQAANGTATAAGTSITYTPNPGYFGPDSFTYTATNAAGTSAPATVTLTVNPQPPTANAVSLAASQDSTNNPVTLNITGGAPVSVAIGTQATNGTATAAGTSITYTPNAGYFGPDSFTYRAANVGGTSAPATVTVTVNQTPTTVSPVSATVAFNSGANPITLNITGVAASVAVGTQATNGTAAAVGTSITYTPNTNYAGPDSFTYTATNTAGTSAPATVTITVSPPAPPTAGPVSLTVAANSAGNPVTLALGGGVTLGVATPTLPTHGSASVAGTSITYTPTAGYSGSDSFTYTATNPGGTTAPATVTVTVSPPTLALSAITLSGQVGVGYSETIAASLGTAPYSFVLAAGSDPLPTGLSLTSGGVLSGTPSAAGPRNLIVEATDAYGATGTRAYALAVAAPTIVITSPSAGALPDGAAGSSYSQTFTATGGFGARTFALTAGALPAGMTLSSAGVLSGTPTVAGTFNFQITVSDSAPTPFSSAPVAYSLTVTAPTITVSPSSLPAATTAAAYSQTITASGGVGATYTYSLSAGALPAGLSLSSGGALSGAPTAVGPFNFTVTATDTLGFTGSRAYTLTVANPTIVVTAPASGALPDGAAGSSYSQTFTAAGGQGPWTFALGAGALPAGVSLTSSGVLSGTPTVAGTFNFTVVASDSSPAPGPFASAPVAYSLTVTAPTITVSPTSLPAATTAAAYSQTITASGGVGATYTYSLSAGALPIGVSLSSGGALSGAPGATGTFNFTVTATDTLGFTGLRAYTLTVANPTITVTAPPAGALPGAQAGVAYSQTFTAAGGQGAKSFSLVSGALPVGMAFSSAGVLSGTPTTAGTFNFTLVAHDNSPAPGPFPSAPVAYSVTVTAPTITVSPSSLPAATTAAAYSQTITASGGVGAYTYSLAAGAMPVGMSFSSAGVLSGAPGAAGTFNFTIVATDSLGFTGSRAYTLTVADPTIVITAPAAGALPGVAAGSSYNQTFTATGGQGAKSFSLVSGALPVGMAFSSAGVLSGTPTTAGTFNFTLVAHDNSPAPGPFPSAPVAYSVTVTAPTITVSPSSLPAATTAAAYSQTITASGGVGAYTYSLAAGAMPVGMSFSSAGVLSGAPGSAGTFNFTIVATDSLGFTGSRAYALTVTDPTIVVTAPAAGPLPAGQAGVAYSQTFTATGGQGAKTFALTAGALPPGVALSSAGVLSGTPTAAGTFNFTVAASDSSPAPGPFVSTPVAYSLTVTAPTIVLAPAAGALPGGLRTVAYSQVFTASGGTGPYGFAITAGALPPGLALASGGTLSGTPTAAGSFGFTVTATDALGFTQAAAYTLAIGTPVPVVQPQTATVVGGQSVTINVTTGATGVDFTSVSVVSPPSHGAAVVQGLTVVYTANGAYSGPDSFTYTVNNAGGASAPGTVTITVNPAVVAAPPKTATILAGQTATVELTDGATGAPFTAAAVVSVGPAGAGTATIAPRTGAGGVQLYDLVFTPADAFTGQATVLYTLSNAFATSAPGTLTITVEPRPDPSLDPDVRGVASSQVTAARRFASAQIDNFQQRLQDLHDGDNRSSSGLSLNLGLAGDEDRDPRQALRRQLDPRGDRLDPGALGDDRERDLLGLDLWSGRAETLANSAGAGALNAAPAAGTGGGGRDPVGFWAAGAVDWGRQDAAGQRDSRFTTHGVTAGVDVRVSDDLIVGGGLGYGEDKTRIGDNGSVSNGTAVSGAAYASWSPGDTVYLDGLIGFSDLEFDSRRWVQGLGGQPDGFAEGRRAGDVLFGSAAIGRLIRRDSWSGDVYARLDAHDITLEAFTETGGGLAALVWNETRQRSLSANLGVNWRWRADMRQRGSIEPSARLEWSYEFEDVGAQGVRYADWRASPTYWIPLDGWSRHALNLDLGADWSLSDRLMLGLRYRGLLGDAASSHGGEFRLRYGW